jgi:hypothetical protein
VAPATTATGHLSFAAFGFDEDKVERATDGIIVFVAG